MDEYGYGYGYGSSYGYGDTGAYGSTTDSGYGYGPGYGNQNVYDSYTTNTQSSTDMWNASVDAYVAGNDQAAYDLNQGSIAASSQASDNWNEYHGYGAYSGAYSGGGGTTDGYYSSQEYAGTSYEPYAGTTSSYGGGTTAADYTYTGTSSVGSGSSYSYYTSSDY